MQLERPSSEVTLKRILDDAYALARRGLYAEALALCDWLIEDNSTRIAGYRERAAILEHMDEIPRAIEDLIFVVDHGGREPADFHALGLLRLQNSQAVEAIQAFGRAIALGEAASNTYYTNSARLLRADAHLRLGQLDEAMRDAIQVPEKYSVYIPGFGMRKKEDIVAPDQKI